MKTKWSTKPDKDLPFESSIERQILNNIHTNKCKIATDWYYKRAGRGLGECITEGCDLYGGQKRFPEAVVLELGTEG